MGQKVRKLQTSTMAALLLALSAFFAPLTIEVDERGNPSALVQLAETDRQGHPDFNHCHKTAACEAPVALLPWSRAPISGKARSMSFSLKLRVPASAALEAPLPPPKAQFKSA